MPCLVYSLGAFSLCLAAKHHAYSFLLSQPSFPFVIYFRFLPSFSLLSFLIANQTINIIAINRIDSVSVFRNRFHFNPTSIPPI
ncbi:hypothetical protein HanIR_Chr17g0859621 [Helianthus annuus]|nr:hypothetical protein HanIR_Chr17g0859621 [Helianthus annuus]